MTKIFVVLVFITLPLLLFCQNYSAELINQQSSIVINNGKLTKDLYYEIRINNRSGEKYTKITIPFSKLNKISKLQAYIKDSNNKIVKKLKRSEITERSSISGFSFYEDNFVKEFTLKYNSYPYTIIYSYEVQQNDFLYIDYWVPLIDEKIPTLTAGLKVCVPSNYSIAYKSRHVNDPEINTLDGTICYRWGADYKEIIKPEVYAPPFSSMIPIVSIVPETFHYDINGSFKNWITYGNWQYRLLQGLNVLPNDEKNKILALIKDVNSEREKIKILYHYLQDETRYINISIETGGMKPYPARYVAQYKYGDCKALTNYFKAMLDYVTIPSYYTKVNAGSPIQKIDTSFPSQQFNHVILFIPQKDDDDIWLDCTSDGAFNYLGTFTQNREALVVNNNNSYFFKTPALKPMDVLNTRVIEVNYNIEDAVVNFHNTYKGDDYEKILFLERNYNESDKSKIIRNNIVSDGFYLDDFQILKQNRDSVKIKLWYKATSQLIYKHYGDDILASNIKLPLPDFAKPGSRKFPVQIDFPIYDIDTLVYEIPPGYNLYKNPENYSIITKYGKYKLESFTTDDKIMIVKSLMINSGSYPVAEYSGFYHFYHQVVDIENQLHLSFYK